MIQKRLLILTALILVAATAGFAYFKRYRTVQEWGPVIQQSSLVCPSEYQPVKARNAETGEIQTFSNDCRVPKGWQLPAGY